MRGAWISSVLALTMAATASAAPAAAKSPSVGVWVDVYYAQWPDQPARTLTVQVPFDSIEKADVICASRTAMLKVAKFIQSRHANLIDKAIFGADCVTDKSGRTKLAMPWPLKDN